MSRRTTDERIARGMQAQLARWRARLGRGERRVGWKVALNAPAVQDQLGISAPVIGFLTSAGELPAGAEHSLANGTLIGVEAEIAIHVQQDVPAGAGGDHLAAAIGALAPAIEIVDIDLPFDDLERILAGNVFHRAFALGAPDRERAGGGVGGLEVSLSRNGTTEQEAEVATALGEPTEVVRAVADLLAESGELLRAGDVIISGALTANAWPKEGDRVEADFGPLGRVGMSFT